MSHSSRYDKDKRAEPMAEPRGFASPPCYQHEIDPSYFGTENPGQNDVSHAAPPWETVRTWRVQERSRLVALRRGLTKQQRSRSTRTIVGHLNATDLLSGHERVGFYWPLRGEVDLLRLLTGGTERGIVAALPVITEPNQPLEFWRWRPGDRLESGHWGIAKPIIRQPVNVTLMFAPMVGFDSENHRLGHGGGYYDRTLAAMDQPPVTIGIGYESCRLPSIFPQPHDIAMDIILTDRGIG